MATDQNASEQVATAETQTDRYEKVTSMLMALVAVIGLVAAFMGLVWLTNQIWGAHVTVGVEMIDVATGDMAGEVNPDADPGQAVLDAVENLPAEEQPEEVSETTPVTETVMNALSEMAADVDSARPDDYAETDGAPAAGGIKGDSGTGGEGAFGTGEKKRWVLVYGEEMSLSEYASMLDQFGIELGTPIGAGRLVYVSNLSAAEPRRRTGAASRERRLYWAWQAGRRRQADIALVRKAGIDAGARIVVQYVPPALERRLFEIEAQYAGARKHQISTTRFGVRRVGSQHEFYVISQGYQ